VLNLLKNAGIEAKGVTRGLDHGVWACFKVAFNPESNPLNVPIVQVSIFNSESGTDHLGLGKAITKLREEGVVVIVSGMAVHNLREFGFGRRGTGIEKPSPYTKSFDEALRVAVEGDPDGRDERMVKLLERQDARMAHPTFDHLLPIFVGAGAAEGEKGKRLWTLGQSSMSWAQYRFGDV
jgi:4,5-DOPA dioxygenase extradiol